jgi:SAM-dependent methyltransferase
MSSDYTYPEFFARFYDVIYDHIRNETDHDYFMNKILSAKGPVLEVGVGTGRFFKEALDKGADIYGIDFSPAMIEVLKNKLPLQEHFRVEVKDICEMKSKRKYKLIVAPFRVFMHLLTLENQLKALDNIYDHLTPGGTFIFDLFVPNLKMIAEGVENMNDFTGEYEPGKKLQRFTTMHADPVNQISHVTFRFVWQEDGKEHTQTWNTDLRFFFRYELQHLLALSKFTDYKLYGDFPEHELTKDSKEFLVVCGR